MSDYMSGDLLTLAERYVWRPFTQSKTAAPPLLATHGSGAWVETADGNRYLDLVSSWWVNLHGHAHPKIVEAINQQAHKIEQVIFAEFTHEPAIRLAAGVAEQLPEDLNRVFYSDDGSTAVEVALKIARQYWSNRGEDRRAYLAFDGAYHGDTVGAMSVGQSSGFFAAWESMLFPVDVLPWPHTWDGDNTVDEREQAALSALDAALANHRGQIAGLIVEPLLQGSSGMRPCRPSFLREVVARARDAGVLIIFDEVMTGFGRTGPLFACQKTGVTPDMVCLSKGLTGGFLPLSMTVVRDGLYDEFLSDDLSRAFLHGHSYTANPLGCAAGLASLSLTLSPDCAASRARIEAQHREHLTALAARYPERVHRPRVCGTVAAFQVGTAHNGYASPLGPRLKAAFHQRGLLLRPLGNTVYLLPPYCITAEELSMAWEGISAVIGEIAV